MSIGLDQSLLIAALEGFEAQLARLEGQIAQVKSLSSGKKVKAAAPVVEVAAKVKGQRRKRREVSEEGRLRMAEAQKRRWEKARAGK
jgi:hypothetical protein